MAGADQVIRWSTALTVAGVAVVAAVVSYEHADALVYAHGELGWTARLIPLTVDGLIWSSSTAMLASARRDVRVSLLARWLLGLGVAATLAANIAHGLGHGLIGSAAGAWPAVALVGSYELLMVIIRAGQSQGTAPAVPEPELTADPLQTRAAEEFADHIAAGAVPSVRLIRARLRARLHVGQSRAQRMRAHLAVAAKHAA
jgi:hypothetical protein